MKSKSDLLPHALVIGAALGIPLYLTVRLSGVESPELERIDDKPVEVELPQPLISIPPPGHKRVEVETVTDTVGVYTVFRDRGGGAIAVPEAVDLASAIVEAKAHSELLRDPEWYALTPDNCRRWLSDFRVSEDYIALLDVDLMAEDPAFAEFLYAYACAQSASELHILSLDDEITGRSKALQEAQLFLTREQHKAFQRLLRVDPVYGPVAEEDFTLPLASTTSDEESL